MDGEVNTSERGGDGEGKKKSEDERGREKGDIKDVGACRDGWERGRRRGGKVEGREKRKNGWLDEWMERDKERRKEGKR